MSLKNLVGISLDEIEPSRETIARLFAAAERNIKDSQDKMIVLDGLRKLRNLSDYSGEMVSEAAVRECVTQATLLLAHVKAWFTANGPDLIGTGPPEEPTT